MAKTLESPLKATATSCNAVSGRCYQGINILLLWIAVAENGYQQCKWITAQAANKLVTTLCVESEKATIVASCARLSVKNAMAKVTRFVMKGNPELEKFAI